MLNIFAKYSCVLVLLWCIPTAFSADIAPQKITVYVTVDWEGWSLENDNIEVMQNFRKKYPHIAMLQLLNPVYYLRADSNAEHITRQIKSTFLPSDAQGLHIHAWKSLMNYCQIPYQHKPSFADVDEVCTEGDCGYTVSLEYAYSQTDLTKLVACSSQVLVKQGFAKPVHFRAGGWQLGHKLTTALQNNGFTWDSSRIDANLLTTGWHVESGMVKMVSALHANSTLFDEPYILAQATQTNAALIEYPNNGGLADYTTTKQIVNSFQQLIEHNKTIMVLGFHQETATSFLQRLDAAIPLLEQLAKQANIQLEWASYQ